MNMEVERRNESLSLANIKDMPWPHNLFVYMGTIDVIKVTDEMKKNLETLIDNVLNEKERMVINAYFRERKSMHEIGDAIGVKNERVRQIIEKSVRILRHRSHRDYIITGKDITTELNMAEKKLERIKIEIQRLESKKAQIINEAGIKKSKKTVSETIKEAKEKGTELPDDDMLRSIRLEKTMKAFGLSSRTVNALGREKINTLYELSKYSAERLVKIRNVGKMVLDEIKEFLSKFSIEIPDEIKNESGIPIRKKYLSDEVVKFLEVLGIATYDELDLYHFDEEMETRQIREFLQDCREKKKGK